VCELTGTGQVLDLYAGVGLFSIALAAAGASRVTAVEGDRASIEDLRVNARPFGSTVLVRHSAVEHFLSGRPEGAESVLVDPPRTGMSSEALEGLLRVKPPRLVYLSCDVATLARDYRRLAEAGYRLEHIEAFDLFPNTAHIETLVVMVHHA
jgi:23S rRNA (uracil1939-C5)-methyltransferase